MTKTVTIRERKCPSDIFHYIEVLISNDSEHLLSSVELDNVHMCGLPTKSTNVDHVRELVLAGDEASADGLLFTDDCVTLAAGETTEFEMCHAVRGQLALNDYNLPRLDPAGNAYNIDALVTAYKAMGDVAIKNRQPFTQVFDRNGNV